MEKHISIKGKHVYNNNVKIIAVNYLIEQFLLVKNIIILLLDTDDDENIVGYDLKGKFMWRVGKLPKIHNQNYFTSIYFENDNLKAYNINGVEALIDIKDGSIIGTELLK